jgi:hypothetical protein
MALKLVRTTDDLAARGRGSSHHIKYRTMKYLSSLKLARASSHGHSHSLHCYASIIILITIMINYKAIHPPLTEYPPSS